MKSDESFERDVRASLLASTDEHAPDDLVVRIGEIPARQPSPSAGRGGLHLAARAVVNLAAAAVVVIAVAALIVTRNGNLPPGGQPNGSGSLPAASALSSAPTCSSPAAPNPTQSAAGTVMVTLGIYSGRPDPAWTLTADQAAGVDAALSALPDGTGTPPAGGLGYHGFWITRPGSTMVAFGGAVAAPGEGSRAMKADPTRSIERCLLETSRSHVTPGEYAIAELAITAPLATSPAASTSPAPPATPSASTPLLGLSPVSATFVSATDGWVLGKGTCSGGSCAAIMRTADAGRTWTPMPAPDAPIFPSPSQVTPGISRLRFADARNGWAYGPDLWATHDGGATWTRLTISGLPADAAVVALEAGNGSVHAAVLDGQGYRIATSPVETDDFRLSTVRVPVGAGPVPAVQLVLSGAAGWLLENDRTVVGGARLVNGTWVAWQPPCLNVVGPAYLAASSSTELAAACDVGLWSSPTGSHLFVSHDGGATFAEAATAVPLTMTGLITTASPSVFVVGGTDATGAILVATFDAGRTWSVVARLGTADPVDLGFTTPTQGVLVATSGDAPATFWMTRDGGHTWSVVGAAGG